MKKIVSILCILILSVSSILAQDNYRIVKGFVVDKIGNPIPGAEVMTPGGGESVLTDSDGSFNISVHTLLKKLTATYDGMTTKTLKIKPDKNLVFTLKKEPKYSAFLNAVLGYSHDKSAYYENTISLGLMSGMLGKWGFYCKAFYDYNDGFCVTAGVVKSIFHRTIFIYAGAGYGTKELKYTHDYYDPYYKYNYFTNSYEGGWSYSYEWGYHPGISSDFGFIFKTGSHFNLTIGYNLLSTLPFTGYNNTHFRTRYAHGLQLGLGYVF